MSDEWWKLVHQGGHHNVWCNGKTHRATEGGYCWVEQGPDARLIRSEYECDCHLWLDRGNN